MSETQTSAYQRVADLEQVREGFVTLFKIAGKPVVLTRVDGAVAAFPGVCSHAAFLLGTSRLVKGCEIECPVHGAQFDARTGAVTKGPAEIGLAPLNVRVEGNDVLVEVNWLAPS